MTAATQQASKQPAPDVPLELGVFREPGDPAGVWEWAVLDAQDGEDYLRGHVTAATGAQAILLAFAEVCTQVQSVPGARARRTQNVLPDDASESWFLNVTWIYGQASKQVGQRLDSADDVKRGDLVTYLPGRPTEEITGVWAARMGKTALVLGVDAYGSVVLQDPVSERLWEFFVTEPDNLRLVARAAYNTPGE